MKAITQKWEESGLLESFSEGQSEELAKIFEDLAQYLISLKKEVSTFDFIFIAIRRIFRAIDKPGKFSLIVDVVDLLKDLVEKWIVFESECSDLLLMSSIDAESEFVYNYCEEYINDLKKRGIIEQETMKENKMIKKMTPLEFVNYLEGYFMIIGDRGLTNMESFKVIEMLKNVEKYPSEHSTLGSKYDYVHNETETSISYPNFYQHRETLTPDQNFVGMSENICYNYIKNKKEDKK
jgi:hypothetical protein